MPSRSLNERIAIVTGAAQGIGRAITERFCKEGAYVIVADIDGRKARKVEEELSVGRSIAKGIGCDVSDVDAVRNLVAFTLKKWGRIDILVNNAGIVGATQPIHRQSVEGWNRLLEIDLSGVFFCCREVIPHMVKRNYGRIINISSIAGKEGNPNMVPYSTAKAGVIGLTKALAKEVAKMNILVNAITPALVETSMAEQLSQEQLRYVTERIPMGRLGRAEEVAAMAAWLASDEISFSTGAVFDVSGGRATY